MHLKTYSKGVFLHIVSLDKKNWRAQVKFIDSLPGIKHVGIWMEKKLSCPEVDFLKNLLKKYEIIIHGPFIHLSLVSPHKEIRKLTICKYLRTLKVAEILGAKLVTFHTGTKVRFLSEKSAIKKLMRNLRKFRSCHKGKVAFTIENLPPQSSSDVRNYFPDSLKDLTLLKKLLPWIKFSVDIGHAFQSGENFNKISRFIRRYKKSILDIHLHDATLRGAAHLALGKGELDVEAFFKLLKDIKYAGYVSLENGTRKDIYSSWKKISKY